MKRLVLTLTVHDDKTGEKLEELYEAFMYMSEENPGKNLIALNELAKDLHSVCSEMMREGKGNDTPI